MHNVGMLAIIMECKFRAVITFKREVNKQTAKGTQKGISYSKSGSQRLEFKKCRTENTAKRTNRRKRIPL